MDVKGSKMGAGFVLLRRDSFSSLEPLMLALVKASGEYDIPKGHQDNNESPIDTAKRECFEESSIMVHDKDMIYGSFVNGDLTTFCAVTGQVPLITKNPETGIVEHSDAKWVSREEFLKNCLSYLAPGVEYFYSEHKRAYNP